LGPIFARLQSEFLEPMLNRCFQLALRDGSFGPIPEALANSGAVLIPEYISPMARAQKMEDVAAMDRYEQSIATTAQLNQGILDLYDFEAASRKKALLLGVPSDVIRSKEQIAKIRNEQAKAQQAQQEAAMQQQMMSDPRMVKNGIDALGGAEGLKELVQAQQ
jgi:hypothetical protein